MYSFRHTRVLYVRSVVNTGKQLALDIRVRCMCGV